MPSYNGRKPGATKLKLTEDDLAKIETLAGYGLTLAQIAGYLGVHYTTLNNYRKDNSDLNARIEKGLAKAAAAVTQSLHSQAKNGNVSAAIFWCKTRLGWSESRKDQQKIRLVLDGSE